MYDIIHWTKHNNKPGIILAADFEAAFESIAWDYLRVVISELNFGQTLIKTINHLYLNTKNSSRILLNGHLSKTIYLQRGIRQGDPASGYLFNLAVSVLTEQIIKSTKLTGIQAVPGHEIRISQYADDTIMFLDGTSRSITGSIEELKKFGDQSGLKINIEKTCCMAIGTSIRAQINTEFNIKFEDKLTILGIELDPNLTNIADRNIEVKMPAIKKELAQWTRRCLTPIGRITIVKALLISKLVHFFITLPNPSTKCTKDLERLLFRFVWGNKKDKIKRTKLIQPYSKDGLCMIHIDSFIKSLKLTWLKRLNSSNADWTLIASQLLPSVCHILTYSSKKLHVIRRNLTNVFYADTIDSIIQFNKCISPSEKDILSESIWFSDWTKYQTTIAKKWDAKGLRFIGDLYNAENGAIYTKQELETIYNIQLTFLCYSALVRSLPKQLQKRVDKTNIQRPNIPYKIQLVTSKNKFSKIAYNTFVENAAEENTVSNERCRTKWVADIGGFKEGTTTAINEVTTNTCLIYLHFRIVNRIYATNKYLNDIKILQNNKCNFCSRATETISHLFWSCPETQIFIKEILSHIRTEYNVIININQVNWFMLTELSKLEIIVITLMKISIHKSRLKSVRPSTQLMMQSLKMEALKEHNIAKAKDKMNTFDDKWGELKKIL